VEGPEQSPILPYLSTQGGRNYDIHLQVLLKPKNGDAILISESNARHLYWNANQQLAHQTVNGCNVRTGDLYASGTISGPDRNSFGSLLELSWNGENPLQLPSGEERTFLEDGDTVIMRGYAAKAG